MSKTKNKLLDKMIKLNKIPLSLASL
uniref:Uncharacterized protein n=1 Tax=Rhizophora mucronata TaxID=61149 RepID=A0A2P2QGF1_RHIMU